MGPCPSNKVAGLASFWFLLFEDRLERKEEVGDARRLFMQRAVVYGAVNVGVTERFMAQ